MEEGGMSSIVWVVVVIIVAAVIFVLWRKKRGSDEPPTKTLNSSILGVTTEDELGTSPQQLIISLNTGSRLTLVPADNDGTPAVQVRNRDQGHLGWLEDGIAAEIRATLDAGGRVECKVADITGGTRGKPSLGVQIQIDLYAARSG